jgi:hypothetical protein
MQRGRTWVPAACLAIVAGCGDVGPSGAARDAGAADHAVEGARARDAAGRDAGGRDAAADHSAGTLPANDADAPIDAGSDGPFDANCYHDATVMPTPSGACCATEDDCDHVTPGSGNGASTCCDEHVCGSCLFK